MLCDDRLVGCEIFYFELACVEIFHVLHAAWRTESPHLCYVDAPFTRKIITPQLPKAVLICLGHEHLLIHLLYVATKPHFIFSEPIESVSKSGPVKTMELRDRPVFFAAASQMIPTFPGLILEKVENTTLVPG